MLPVHDVSNLWAEMESSRPNGTQHHIRGNKSALSLQQPNVRVALSPVQMCRGWTHDKFLCFQTPHFLSEVTWSTACLPFLQMQAEAWLASVPGESMREPERGHRCCTDQKGTWTPGSVGKTVNIFPASKGHEYIWIFCQKSQFNAEIISSTLSQYFFLHSSITLSLQWPLRLGLCAHVLLFLPCFFNNPALPQTSTHQVSSNLAACPWVCTVTKAHFSLFFWCCTLTLMAKMCNLLRLVFLWPQKMHCHCKINYLTTHKTATLFYFLFKHFSVHRSATQMQTFICPTDTAVQSLHKCYLLHLFLESLVWL